MTGAPDANVARVTTATWLGFSMMALGMFMAILDIQIVATSLPTIRAALAIAPEQMSWIQTAYLTAENGSQYQVTGSSNGYVGHPYIAIVGATSGGRQMLEVELFPELWKVRTELRVATSCRSRECRTSVARCGTRSKARG
jgi:hypothetical protein